MTVIRTGTDLTAVDDVVRGIATHGERYLARIFTDRERADSGDDPERLAARFAGKEAVVKLLRPSRADPCLSGTSPSCSTRTAHPPWN
ncbi:phosphopantetheinyl transferase (holo-ACP synthase) [Curtobacterium luteum]|uniref:Phosphopantetheinyl transferase (Holo-ACP synthase) n=1 Tax=Curtobacterium luteum TaxID=33881 RepID=A0A8H9GBU8_9MICO|nr:4'-phosphopantetheinyl transferase superfamily protein [Curtobacterium luteum]MBM7801308.1 phosphopantetheinyl transferase (holo-ACP synthase) [Curtobacterium luteum]NUU49987.1 4'-phosphopantetheinyl transferase superfamily protein [Curtobacterium luteum]GGL12561.1 hypothetical protein GCM10009769_33160 [Curtobacterium luteum]